MAEIKNKILEEGEIKSQKRIKELKLKLNIEIKSIFKVFPPKRDSAELDGRSNKQEEYEEKRRKIGPKTGPEANQQIWNVDRTRAQTS